MDSELKPSSKETLFTRLVKIISWLTFSTVMLFTGATLLITYSFEDVLFNERLKQAHTKISNGQPLPYDISLIDNQKDKGAAIYQTLQDIKQKKNNSYGEFNFEDRNYHYLITENKTILYDTTEVTIIDRALEDVLLIFVILLIPVMLITYLVAKIAARYALKPFTVLTDVFANNEAHSQIKAKVLSEVKEQDVIQVALTLANTLEQKSNLLEQQVIFNQGMAHELRTPLQVMKHSVELLSSSHENLQKSPAFERLKGSINRMNRLSDGLLWLTSDQTFNDYTDVSTVIEKAIHVLSDLAQAHHIVIKLNTANSFQLPLPETVLELIVFNLFNNVVHHGNNIDSQITWDIYIGNTEICFRNPVNLDSNRALDVEHFGVGLTLVLQLSNRFDLKTAIDDKDGHFVVTLKK